MFGTPTIRPFGERAILIQWNQLPSSEFLSFLKIVQTHINSIFQAEIVLTYQELLVKNTDSTVENLQRLEICLREINTQLLATSFGKCYKIPVCYDTSFGVDLEAFAKAKNLSIKKVINLHTAPQYLVYFIGFLPGFPYLLGLDEQLHMPRKSTPSSMVARGSIAIGGSQTGVYPQESPGGWHVIGNCPVPIFDGEHDRKTLFKSGDKIQFVPITYKQHQKLLKYTLVDFLNSSFVANE